MSERLDKARQAVDDAAALGVDLTEKILPPVYNRLLSIASVQAEIATAEALTRIADMLDEDRDQKARSDEVRPLDQGLCEVCGYDKHGGVCTGVAEASLDGRCPPPRALEPDWENGKSRR